MEILLENVSKSYPGLSIGPVNLRVPSGTLMVLEGANGSGKTTLLELIAGTVEPDSGEVLLGGRRGEGLAPIDRGVFYIPQTLHKFWSMQHESRLCFIPRRTVRENLLAAAGDYGEAMEWLCRLDLEDYADETPERLSFGLQQRLALARAVLLRPGVILIDEGLSSLDPGIRLEVFELLRRIPERTENTVVYVTHHKDDADRLGGTLYRFRDGNIFRASAGRQGAEETKARLLEAFALFLDEYLGRPDRSDAVRARIQENLDAFRPAHPGGLAEYGEESVEFLSAQLRLGDGSPDFKKNLARWLGVERALLERGPEGIREKLLGRGGAAAAPEAPSAAPETAILLGLPGDDLAGFLLRLERSLREHPGGCEVRRVSLPPGSPLRGMAIRRGLSYDPKPPYEIRSTPTFPARDLQEAERISRLARTLMSSPAVREAMERAARAADGRWSCVGACREIAKRLKRRGLRAGLAAKELPAVLREIPRLKTPSASR